MSIRKVKIALVALVFISLAWHFDLGNDYDGRIIPPHSQKITRTLLKKYLQSVH
ncbi:hypothetical protein NSA18_11945 [Pasteurella caecimuris]|uniref:hypothetical protein n=1 Tax=Rodentibacter caecimuris TaxID=1796644 RepID=UPI00214FEC14|nr:hypothetical protein [Pasteurella caecimuris]MCR1838587.1 hypothetical protein [Pasteurella caecimuris]MCU0107884.1 hypothetical protein [Pasteurella caecimuris]